MTSILDEITDHEESLRLVSQAKKQPNILKCAFCPWQRQAWRTTKKGHRVNAYSALRRHIWLEHEEEWKKIEDIE